MMWTSLSVCIPLVNPLEIICYQLVSSVVFDVDILKLVNSYLYNKFLEVNH